MHGIGGLTVSRMCGQIAAIARYAPTTVILDIAALKLRDTFSAKPLKSRQVDGNKKPVMTEMRLLSKLCIAFWEDTTGSNISAKVCPLFSSISVQTNDLHQVSSHRANSIAHGAQECVVK